MPQLRPGSRVVALCGGVGGAKLAFGLDAELPAGHLSVVTNTGDDFTHLGLHVSPDIDTVLYTLSGLSDYERGWGRRDETWNFMAALGELGGEAWFNLGDRDLALHVERTRRLQAGETLTSVMAGIAAKLGVRSGILPMSDDAVRTVVRTAAGNLPFQHYFVKHRCEPFVTGVTFDGAAAAGISPAVERALADPALGAIIICPSNPYLSIDPVLSVPGMRRALERSTVPVIAVSPLIGGQAVKGPTAKIMRELGISATTRSIAEHYGSLLDGLVVDESDAAEAAALGLRTLAVRTLMTSADDKRRLAGDVLAFAAALGDEGVSQ